MNSLFTELRRRHVFRVAATYCVVAWVVIQAASIAFPAFDAPPWVLRAVIAAAVLGFPLAIVLAWAFELTPEGVRRADVPRGEPPAPDVDVADDRADGPARGRRRRAALWAGTVGMAALVSVGSFALMHERAPTVSAASAGAGASDESGTASIAVLPFVNISSDSEQEYFSDGLTEELLNRLSRVPTLRVASRTSSFAFKGSRVSVAEIAQTLNVRRVLVGSVRKSGSRLRINAQLINASDGYQLWSAEFDRELDDIFTIQEEISRSIVTALEARLDPGASAALAAETTNVEAYNLFLQARFFWAQRTMTGLARAQALLERAIQIEPEFARAHAALADVHYIAHEYSSTPQPELVDRIIQAAKRAAALDSTLAEPWAALGGAYERRQRWADAEAAYDRAIALNPRYATAHQWRAWLLGYMGRHEEALAGVSRALALEPMSLIINTNVGEHLLNLHRHEEALAQFSHVLELDSMFAPAIGLHAVVSSIRGDHAMAVRMAERLLGLPGVRGRYDLGRAAFALGNAGQRDRARQILVEMEGRGLWAFTAQGWLALGDEERALQALDRALRAEDPSLPRVITIDAATVPLFNQPRVVALRRRMNLE